MIVRLNLLLIGIAILCAISVVTARHNARNLFVALQKEQDMTMQLDVERDQLLIEQSTWSMHSRIEKIAVESLKMRVPPASRIRIVDPSKGTLRR